MSNLYSGVAEATVISSILIEPEVLIGLNLKPSDFGISAHQIIFKTILELPFEDINLTALVDKLEKNKQLATVGGVAYLGKILTYKMGDCSLTDANAKLIKEYALKREIESLLEKGKKELSTMHNEEIISLSNNIKNILLDAEKQADDLFVDASTLDRKKQQTDSIETGFPVLDTFLGGGLAPGTMTVLTGTPSSGKSTIINQMVANAISKGFKSFIYSGELTNEMLIDWFSKTVVNEKDLEERKNFVGESYFIPNDYSFNLIKNWVKQKLYVFSKSARATEDNLTSVIEFLATRKNVKLFVLDNLMTIEAKSSAKADKYQKQIEIVTRVKELAKNYGLSIILIAHPNKASNVSTEHNMYDVSGAAEIVNLADYCIKNIRNQDNTSSLLILKNRITGQQNKKIETFFNSKRKRFSTNAGVELKRDYGYDEKTTAAQCSFTETKDEEIPF